MEIIFSNGCLQHLPTSFAEQILTCTSFCGWLLFSCRIVCALVLSWAQGRYKLLVEHTSRFFRLIWSHQMLSFYISIVLTTFFFTSYHILMIIFCHFIRFLIQFYSTKLTMEFSSWLLLIIIFLWRVGDIERMLFYFIFNFPQFCPTFKIFFCMI